MATRLATYSARFTSPDLIERAKTQQLALEVQSAGAVVAPASGTLTLRDSTNTAIVNAAAITVTNGIAEYELAAATVPATLPLAQDWIEEWTLTFADGQVHTFRRTAHLCRRRLYPVLTQAAILKRHRNLNDLVEATPTAIQDAIDDAWDSILARLQQDQAWPQLVMTPDSFYEVHFSLTCQRLFLDMMTNAGGGDDVYAKLAEFYGEQFTQGWASLKFVYDQDESGTAPGEDDQGGASSVIYLGGAPARFDRFAYGTGRR